MNHSDSNWQEFHKRRSEIDGIDEAILKLLARRQTVSRAIGNAKKELELPIMDPGREGHVLRRLVEIGGEEIAPDAIRRVFREIISACRSVQEDMTIAYLGPPGTFSHQAAIAFFGQAPAFQPVDTLDDVFAAVEKDVCQDGVVPIENAYEGAVSRTLDLLYRSPLRIQGETFLRIRHHLLSRCSTLSEVRCVYSHPMALAQCRGWLRSNLPGVPCRETSSTAAAARLASEEAGAAAVGGQFAAMHLDLSMLVQDIQDYADNVTRFLAIGKRENRPSGHDKTSVLFSLRHRPGSLYEVLEPLARNGINMTRIESRPMKTKTWEYLFFADLEGHERETPLREALPVMDERCAFLKRLGSYPKGGEPWS
ncbi:prephenate dehydratase [Desulfatiglans anilini]|uniref:prephenate dehydratase n=1 Tax=Desulfatiglans anilini TaxID=90728 RepID=UPI000684C08C|nr:prephenate dehydratase [Desulfatiglans anilini]